MKKEVLGVKIDDISLQEAVKVVGEWLSRSGKHYIVTPNPEFVVRAQQNEQFKRVLNDADLSIPDGVGLKLAGDIVCNTPGIDLMEELVKMSAEKGFTTGFLGGEKTVAKKTADCLSKKYKNLKVVFAESGGEVDEDGNMINDERLKIKDPKSLIINHKSLPKADLLFVAFGPPKQEMWIAKNLDKLDVKVMMGVGGAFDIFSGKVPRAPIILRKIGLEWLFRLIIQPWRVGRQLALVKFVWLLVSRAFKK